MGKVKCIGPIFAEHIAASCYPLGQCLRHSGVSGLIHHFGEIGYYDALCRGGHKFHKFGVGGRASAGHQQGGGHYQHGCMAQQTIYGVHV